MKCIDMHHAIRMARMQKRPSSCNSVLFYEFKHRTSSHYPQSNAKSENAVKIVKILVRK